MLGGFLWVFPSLSVDFVGEPSKIPEGTVFCQIRVLYRLWLLLIQLLRCLPRNYKEKATT
ncbi:unnamed protein product [Heterobilharzia americana]|nr:unnamed protein product [Heterobilharzia americana]